jgi:hypothetical protein
MYIPKRGAAVLIEYGRYLQFYEKLLSELTGCDDCYYPGTPDTRMKKLGINARDLKTVGVYG